MDWCWAGVLSKPKSVARYLRGCRNLKCGFPFSTLIDTEQAAVAVKAPIPKRFCIRHPFHSFFKINEYGVFRCNLKYPIVNNRG